MKKGRKIQATDFLRALAARQTRRQLMRRFRLSSRGLDRLMDRLLLERRSRAFQIATDFRAGMPVAELAVKNGFRAENFEKILKKIEDLGVLNGELPGAHTSETHELHALDRRAAPRLRSPVLVTKVCEATTPECFGMIDDLSETGLRIKGICADLNVKKTLIMNVADYVDADPISFEVQCRWNSTRDEASGGTWAGFEITSISEHSLALLRTILAAELSLSDAA